MRQLPKYKEEIVLLSLLLTLSKFCVQSGFRRRYSGLFSKIAWLDLWEGSQLTFTLFKVNNRNTRKRCEICSKLTIKAPEWPYWCRSCEFIVNFEHSWTPFSVVSTVDFEQVNVNWKWFLMKVTCSSDVSPIISLQWLFHVTSFWKRIFITIGQK